jgi:hypothetical protein
MDTILNVLIVVFFLAIYVLMVGGLHHFFTFKDHEISLSEWFLLVVAPLTLAGLIMVAFALIIFKIGQDTVGVTLEKFLEWATDGL